MGKTRAAEGCQIVGADYKQQELNVLAQVSGDKNLQEAIETGCDLHGLAAAGMLRAEVGLRQRSGREAGRAAGGSR